MEPRHKVILIASLLFFGSFFLLYFLFPEVREQFQLPFEVTPYINPP